MSPEIIHYLQHLTYFGIFFLLSFLDALIPLPEEIILIMVGYTVFFGTLDPSITVLVAIAAFLVGDNITFWLSRGGSHLIGRLKNRMATPLIEKYSQKMRSKAGITLLIMTFLPNIRFFAPIVAGSVRTPWKTFILYDIVSVGLYVSIYLLAGYFFHSQINGIIQEFELLGHLLMYVFLIAIGIWLGFLTRKIYMGKKSENQN
ncbi:MAG: DedA family protein [Chlorobiales bacterium]|nr:DedA family protein [Chlorobiales bacterium]